MNHPHDNDDRTIPSPVSGEDLGEAGINVGKPGFYDPERGAKKVKTPRPEPIYGPLLATDPGQPGNIEAKGIHRQRNSAIERGERVDSKPSAVVSSKDKPTGRKAGNAGGQE
jgi:hypothetical protein